MQAVAMASFGGGGGPVVGRSHVRRRKPAASSPVDLEERLEVLVDQLARAQAALAVRDETNGHLRHTITQLEAKLQRQQQQPNAAAAAAGGAAAGGGDDSKVSSDLFRRVCALEKQLRQSNDQIVRLKQHIKLSSYKEAQVANDEFVLEVTRLRALVEQKDRELDFFRTAAGAPLPTHPRAPANDSPPPTTIGDLIDQQAGLGAAPVQQPGRVQAWGAGVDRRDHGPDRSWPDEPSHSHHRYPLHPRSPPRLNQQQALDQPDPEAGDGALLRLEADPAAPKALGEGPGMFVLQDGLPHQPKPPPRDWPVRPAFAKRHAREATQRKSRTDRLAERGRRREMQRKRREMEDAQREEERVLTQRELARLRKELRKEREESSRARHRDQRFNELKTQHGQRSAPVPHQPHHREDGQPAHPSPHPQPHPHADSSHSYRRGEGEGDGMRQSNGWRNGLDNDGWFPGPEAGDQEEEMVLMEKDAGDPSDGHHILGSGPVSPASSSLHTRPRASDDQTLKDRQAPRRPRAVPKRSALRHTSAFDAAPVPAVAAADAPEDTRGDAQAPHARRPGAGPGRSHDEAPTGEPATGGELSGLLGTSGSAVPKKKRRIVFDEYDHETVFDCRLPASDLTTTPRHKVSALFDDEQAVAGSPPESIDLEDEPLDADMMVAVDEQEMRDGRNELATDGLWGDGPAPAERLAQQPLPATIGELSPKEQQQQQRRRRPRRPRQQQQASAASPPTGTQQAAKEARHKQKSELSPTRQPSLHTILDPSVGAESAGSGPAAGPLTPPSPSASSPQQSQASAASPPTDTQQAAKEARHKQRSERSPTRQPSLGTSPGTGLGVSFDPAGPGPAPASLTPPSAGVPSLTPPSDAAAATKLQSVARGRQGQRRAAAARADRQQQQQQEQQRQQQEREKQEREREQREAATRLQAVARGRTGKAAAATERRQARQRAQEAAARAEREAQARAEEDESARREEACAATTLQAAQRRRRAAARAQVLRNERRAEAGTQARAATGLQAAFRGHRARNEVGRRRQAREEALAAELKRAEEEEARRHEEELAAERKRAKEDEEARREAATGLQAAFRGRHAREDTGKRRRARADQLAAERKRVQEEEERAAERRRAEEAEEAARQRGAATGLQAAFRGHHAREETEKRRRARADQLAAERKRAQEEEKRAVERRRAEEAEEAARLRGAATGLQAAFRGHHAREETEKRRRARAGQLAAERKRAQENEARRRDEELAAERRRAEEEEMAQQREEEEAARQREAEERAQLDVEADAELEADAATKIQAAVRGREARARGGARARGKEEDHARLGQQADVEAAAAAAAEERDSEHGDEEGSVSLSLSVDQPSESDAPDGPDAGDEGMFMDFGEDSTEEEEGTADGEHDEEEEHVSGEEDEEVFSFN